MKELRNLKRVAIEELEKLDAEYASKSEFDKEDADLYKCLVMALEKHMRIEQIESEMHGEVRGYSSTGMSNGYRGSSYADGYSEGYREGVNQSGHWPPMGPWPNGIRY